MGKKKTKKKQNPIVKTIRQVESGIKRGIPLAALIMPGAAHLMAAPNIAGAQSALARYTGFHMADGSFKPERLIEGWGPFIASKLIIKVANMFGGR